MAHISTPSLLQYGLIAIPVAFAGFPLYILGPDYYATQHGVSLTLLAALLLVIRSFDAIQDPLFGWLIDRKRTWLMPVSAIAAIVLCLAITGLFNFVVYSPPVWFAICMFFAVTAYSLLTITMGAVGTLWTADHTAQTRIASAREGSALVGLIVAVSLPGVFAAVFTTDEVYFWYGLALVALMALGLWGLFRTIKLIPCENILHAAERTPSFSILSAIKAVPRETKQLLLVYGLSMLAASTPAVLVVFFVRDRLAAEHLLGVFMLLYFLSGAVAMPLWKKASQHIGKAHAWAVAGLLSIIGFVGAFFLGAGDIYAYAAVCVVSGLALGADLTLPPSMLADHVHAHNNSRFAATHYAFIPFISKASLAIATGIALPALEMAGFRPDSTNDQMALSMLSTIYALIPCVLKLAAVILMYHYFIRRTSLARNTNT